VTFVIFFGAIVNRLSRADLSALLLFVHDASALVGGPDVFPRPVLARLARLIPSDEVSYWEHDETRKRTFRGASTMVDYPDPHSVHDERFWRILPLHPLCRYHARTRDFRAVKLTDFLTLRQLRRNEVYREWYGFFGIERELLAAIPSPLWHKKAFGFHRESGRDFSERDRQVLNLLLPHLGRLYEIARLRQRVDREIVSDEDLPLTRREREILVYLRRGHTNREIGEILFISPLTVRRHLERIYEKLGVHSRTAAAARAFRLAPSVARPAGP
jgi:DNA-binding CsgD family transcriptional regulator